MKIRRNQTDTDRMVNWPMKLGAIIAFAGAAAFGFSVTWVAGIIVVGIGIMLVGAMWDL